MMRKQMMATLAAIALLVTAAVTFGAMQATAADRPVLPVAGGSPDDPIVVGDPSDVPEGAVEDDPSTYNTPQACDTTRSWVHTVPATDDQTHQEWGTEKRKRHYYPGHEEKSHQEYKYKKKVETPSTEYHFAKFTHTKVKHSNGAYGPYGAWTKWSPETHTSWQANTTPLGSPAFHSEGIEFHNGHIDHWYREWQAMSDGGTRPGPVTVTYDYTDWTTDVLGAPWVKIDERKVVDQEATPASYGPWSEWMTRTTGELSEPVLPENTDTREYRITGPVTVHDEDGTPEVVTYYAYTDAAVCDKPEGFEDTDTSDKCVDGDLVTTTSTVTGTPVQAEDGSWTIEESAASSQSIEKNALDCADNPQPPRRTSVPTLIDAGL